MRGEISIYDYKNEKFVKDAIRNRINKLISHNVHKINNNMLSLEKIEQVATDLGWEVYYSERYSEPDYFDFEFTKFTPYGQDFVVSAIMDGNNPQSLVESLQDGYEAFDPDYEASLWIGDDGHGKKGAPYHIKDIVTDMEEAEKMYMQLADAIEQEFQNYELTEDTENNK